MSSYNYAFIVTDTPINLLNVNLPNGVFEANYSPLSSSRCLVLGSGGHVERGVTAVLAVYPDARATTSKEEAAEWLKQRHITPHKGGRTIKRSTDVTPETNERLRLLAEHGISLGDLIEEAAAAKYAELNV